MGIKLYVDDWRHPPSDKWVLAKTITEAITILATQAVDVVSLDHDITFETNSGYRFGNETFAPVAWFISVMPEHDRPKLVVIHTANPVGAANMLQILKGYGGQLVRTIDYEKDWDGNPNNDTYLRHTSA